MCAKLLPWLILLTLSYMPWCFSYTCWNYYANMFYISWTCLRILFHYSIALFNLYLRNGILCKLASTKVLTEFNSETLQVTFWADDCFDVNEVETAGFAKSSYGLVDRRRDGGLPSPGFFLCFCCWTLSPFGVKSTVWSSNELTIDTTPLYGICVQLLCNVEFVICYLRCHLRLSRTMCVCYEVLGQLCSDNIYYRVFISCNGRGWVSS